MADAKRRENWSHTSHIMSLMANVNRDVKKRRRPYAARDFSPFANRPEAKTPKTSIRLLKEVFVDER